jgi:hypothetical protein
VLDHFINGDDATLALSLRLRQSLPQKQQQYRIEETQRTAPQENRYFDFVRLDLTGESYLVVTVDYEIQEQFMKASADDCFIAQQDGPQSAMPAAVH